ncbi:MAG: hypothetical protein Q8J68_11035 [Methanolobus sp.]|uniref:hypothetical protein n=1 Tax=Methanolobus sp. TaxID=1874737 RepID=UPI00272FE160|nr:hypothetical protein [Methanolobus sp.]MDP2217805.1 hypothetical protein [Methanolobus sp.]
MNFAPASCMCLYCKERTFITEPAGRTTRPRCAEVVELVTGKKLRLSRTPVSPGGKASSLPVVERKEGDLGL